MKDLNDPTNRDSVPAMLTPGEFVINKEASQKYAPLLEKINNEGLAMRHVDNIPHYNTGGLVDFLKKHEGWRDKAYQDSAGIWTIGYGRTFNDDGSPVTKGQTTNKEAEDKWITKRAQQDFNAVSDWAKGTGEDYTQKELESLASFRYNLGPGGFNQLTADGTRDKATIQSKMPLYVNAGGRKVDGLVNRRNYEMEHAGWGAQPEVEETTAPVPPTEQPPIVQQQAAPVPQQEVDVSPQAEAADQISLGQSLFPMGGADNAVLQALGGGLLGGGHGGTGFGQIGGRQPIRSAEQIRMGQNDGGPVPPVTIHLNDGGWLSSLFGWGNQQPAQDPNAGYANYSQQDFLKEAETFNNPGAQTQGYETIPGMSAPSQFGTSMVPPTGIPPYDSAPNQSLLRPGIAEHVGNRFNMEAPGMEVPPELATAPPVPGTDEALLQGSSQAVESIEAEQYTAKQQWDRLKEQRDAQPKGSPQRVALSNEMNKLNVAGPALDPRIGLGSGAATGARGEAVPELPTAPPPRDLAALKAEIESLPDDEQNAAIEALPPGTQDALYALDDSQFQTNEALQQAQMQAAVTAPDNPNAGFQQSRVDALQDQATSLGIPPESQGVGTDVGVTADPLTGMGVPQGMVPPNAAGAVPGLDVASPEQIIEKGPEVFTNPDALDPRNDAASGFNPTSKDNLPATKAAVEERLAVNAETATPEETSAAEAAGRKASPAKVEKAKGILEENFGGLFDKKELARAALLFAGAMATGASPQKALAIAGQQYMGRLDAKEAMKVKNEQQAAAAAAKGRPTIDMTQSEDFVVDGKKVKGFKMTKTLPDGTKVTDYVGKDGMPLSADRHQNFDQVQGTPEYNKRVQSEAKQYSGMMEEAEKAFDDIDGNKISGILPKTSGADVAKWAIKNNVPPEAMGQLVRNAYQAAVDESRGGKKATNITAFLNDQYIEARVGDPNIFKGAPADEVSSLMDTIEAQSGKSSTEIVQAALPLWNGLSPEEKKSWESRAKKSNKTAFMLWMENDVM